MKIFYPQESEKMTFYGIVYEEYSILANDYIRYLKIIQTNDIFHHVGMMIYKAFCEIKSIRWFEIDVIEDFEERMRDRGSVKLSDDLYRLTLFECDKK